MKKFILFIFCTLFGSVFAVANDTAGQLLPTEEISFKTQDGIVLKHEALLLSDTVTVDYLFENITDKPIEIDVLFPIPAAWPFHDDIEEPQRHDFKFRVWSNGQEITPKITTKITLNGTDVTKYFDLMGINAYYKSTDEDQLWDMSSRYENFIKAAEPLRKLPLEEQKKLEELGMLVKGCFHTQVIPLTLGDFYPDKDDRDDDCEKALADYELAKQFTIDRDSFEKSGARLPSYIDVNNKSVTPINYVISHYHVKCHNFLPKEMKCSYDPDVYRLEPTGVNPYKLEVIYYWKQTFPPHKVIHIRHEYKPSWLEIDISFSVWHIVEKDKEKKELEWGNTSSYIITTANNWKTPIEKFNLLVWGKVGAAVNTMGKDGPTYVRVAPKNYLLDTKQDFMPTSEISFALAEAFKMPQIIPQLYRVDGPANVLAKPDGKKIKTLENGYYIWAYPSDNKDWYAVLLDEETTGYTRKDNLIPFGKFN